MYFLFIPAAAYVGAVGYYLKKDTIPAWLGRYMKRIRDGKKDLYKERVDLIKKNLSWITVVAFYVVFSVINNGWMFLEDGRFGAPLMFIWIATFVAVVILIQRHISGMWSLHEQIKGEGDFIDIVKQHNPTRWATDKEIDNVFSDIGKITLDDLSGVNVGGSLYLKFAKKGHILTVGSARAGKGTCLLLPPILDASLKADCAPSFITLDPRGENLAVSGERLKELGYKLIVLNPYNIPEIAQFGNSHFNPFDLFNVDSPEFNKYVDLIRYAIIPAETERHPNAYFSEAASELISLYIRHMMTQDEEPKNIVTLYRWLRLAGEDRINLFAKMEKNDLFDISHDARSVMQQLDEGGKSITDVYGNATVAIGMFKDQQIREAMASSDFNLADIAKEKTALFICLGSEDMERMKVWMRIVLASIMRGFIRNYSVDRKVVMLLDEFYSLGRISEFDNVQMLANYNITAWVVLQDLNQIKNLYPRTWEGFVNNSVIRHWLKIGDNFTAEYLSKRLGNTIINLGKNSDGSPRYKEKPFASIADIKNSDNIVMEADGVEHPILIPRKPYWEYIDNYGANPFYKNRA